MSKAQVDFDKKEFGEMSMFRFKINWTVQKLLRRAVLYYIRNDPEKKLEEILNPNKE